MTPEPRKITICSACGIEWYLHIERHIGYEDEDEALPAPDYAAFVTLVDCVDLLLAARRGPQGIPGMQGPAGVRGADGKDLR